MRLETESVDTMNYTATTTTTTTTTTTMIHIYIIKACVGNMLVEPKTEFESTEQEAGLLLLGVPQGNTRIGDDTQDISLPSTHLRSMLLRGSVNETPMPHCHISNSSMEGNYLYFQSFDDICLLMEMKLNAASARYSQRSNSTTILKPHMSCASQKIGIIQLPSENSAVPKLCDRDKIPEHLPNTMRGLSFSASVKIESDALDDKVMSDYMYGGTCTNLLISNMSNVDMKKSISQLPSETSAIPKICAREEILEHFPNTMPSSNFSASVEVESEASDSKVMPGHMYGGSYTVKEEVSFKSKEDKLDHVPFKERIRMLRVGQNNETNHGLHEESVCSGAAVLGGARPSEAIRLRKRKKTATASASTALEEDAPGLLKVLIESGVLTDDIRLYDGQMDSDDLDDALPEESFTELENVITKIFARNTSLLKLTPIRFAKGSRTPYCLECLMALVEQAKYLKLRKWPVEWGWCRDIQSFIFVFERQNRIVLEHPEYGYATYFFETMASLPISWQIKRLIIAMKLTSCRLNILENKILQVGKELSEGEAQVLMNYGWMPNTGLGTMLNYCDRVIHDRKTEEKYSSEWRSKIGSLLIAGLNGGSIVSKVYLGGDDVECVDANDASIKLEV
ncbi:unnamed protein product [Rhodiola kirilowii]